MPDPILYWEGFTLVGTPSDITALILVDKDEDSDDDKRNLPFNELLKEFKKADHIEGFAKVQEAAKDITRISQIVGNCLLNQKSTLCGGDSLLESKLHLIIAEEMANQDEDAEIKDLEENLIKASSIQIE